MEMREENSFISYLLARIGCFEPQLNFYSPTKNPYIKKTKKLSDKPVKKDLNFSICAKRENNWYYKEIQRDKKSEWEKYPQEINIQLNKAYEENKTNLTLIYNGRELNICFTSSIQTSKSRKWEIKRTTEFTQWCWKSNLDLKDSDPNSWKLFSQENQLLIEEAYTNDKKSIKVEINKALVS